MVCKMCKVDKDFEAFGYSKLYIPKCKKCVSLEYKQWRAKYGRKQDKNKVRVYTLVRKAIKEGRLVKPEVCSRCKAKPTGRIEAHHSDYSKPLDVVWVCNQCHKIVHVKT